MTRPLQTQALSAIVTAAGAALDALTPPVALQLANFKPASTDNVAWWVEVQRAGGTSTQAEVGPPDPSNARDMRDVVQFMIRGPRDVGEAPYLAIAATLEAALCDVPLTLDDPTVPLTVPSVTIGALRPADELGRQSMPVVLFLDALASRA